MIILVVGIVNVPTHFEMSLHIGIKRILPVIHPSIGGWHSCHMAAIVPYRNRQQGFEGNHKPETATRNENDSREMSAQKAVSVLPSPNGEEKNHRQWSMALTELIALQQFGLSEAL